MRKKSNIKQIVEEAELLVSDDDLPTHPCDQDEREDYEEDECPRHHLDLAGIHDAQH